MDIDTHHIICAVGKIYESATQILQCIVREEERDRPRTVIAAAANARIVDQILTAEKAQQAVYLVRVGEIKERERNVEHATFSHIQGEHAANVDLSALYSMGWRTVMGFEIWSLHFVYQAPLESFCKFSA